MTVSVTKKWQADDKKHPWDSRRFTKHSWDSQNKTLMKFAKQNTHTWKRNNNKKWIFKISGSHIFSFTYNLFTSSKTILCMTALFSWQFYLSILKYSHPDIQCAICVNDDQQNWQQSRENNAKKATKLGRRKKDVVPVFTVKKTMPRELL